MKLFNKIVILVTVLAEIGCSTSNILSSQHNLIKKNIYSVSGIAPLYMTPVAIFEDGSHVYIQMPPTIVNHNLPGFFLIDEDGKYKSIYIHYENNTYTIDGIFEKGVLIANKNKLFITKN